MTPDPAAVPHTDAMTTNEPTTAEKFQAIGEAAGRATAVISDRLNPALAAACLKVERAILPLGTDAVRSLDWYETHGR